MSWIGDPSRTSSVLCFNGPPGSGKTAIALQTMCCCKVARRKFFLLATYRIPDEGIGDTAAEADS
jgi:ATP-dependent Lon protease